MISRFKFGLKLRVFLSYALFFLAALGALTFLTIRSQRNLLLEEMGDRARVGINLMELSVSAPLYRMDIYYLGAIAREAKALPDVDYAYIYDDKGRIVGDYHEDNRLYLATLPDELSQRIVKSDKILLDIDYNKEILNISKPVILGHQKLGGIRLGFNLKPMLTEMRSLTIRSLVISTVIFLLGAAIIFGIAMRMVQPIERLTVAAKRIEAGDLEYRVRIERDDEIGSLATAFDQMAERLMKREKELKESQKTLRRADRLSSLGLLTAGLAHEIRNPLVAIRTFTQLLPERYNDAEFRDGFQGLALKEVDRICGLINDLLSFARPSRPKVDQENMNDAVDGITRILETEAKEKNVEITRDFAASLPKVWIDREQMKQVFMNVILNAIQAMKGEGGAIAISTRLHSSDQLGQAGQFVQVEIRDTGMGIPEENLDHIFDPFFTNKDEGSGLGLSISHQIVQEHGGYVTVESKVGVGTSFFVNIPIGKSVRPPLNDQPYANEESFNHR